MITEFKYELEKNYQKRINGFDYFKYKRNQKLHEAYQEINGDPPSATPFIVWLLENPDSPLPFPGKIDLKRHDYLHLLLERGFSLSDEAFVVGFTMGNDSQTTWFHLIIYKLVSTIFFPTKYRFTKEHLIVFDLGFWYGRKVQKNINNLDFLNYQNQSISQIRKELGIDLYSIHIIWKTKKLLTYE